MKSFSPHPSPSKYHPKASVVLNCPRQNTGLVLKLPEKSEKQPFLPLKHSLYQLQHLR
jgi:hypothetical protein